MYKSRRVLFSLFVNIPLTTPRINFRISECHHRFSIDLIIIFSAKNGKIFLDHTDPLTVLIVIFTYGLFEIDNACHSENNYEDCIHPIKHPLIDSLLGITDILTFFMFSKKFRFKLPIIKVLLTTSCFTLFFMNLILVLVSNPSLANPGPASPKRLTVFYQNIQGFVDPGKGLTNPCPVLNPTKLIEFQTYIYSHAPDIVCLSETWLWGEFGDSEILCPERYKLFRLDRCKKTHPLDPVNPKKFKVKGGGVLIAVRADLDKAGHGCC